MQSLYFHIQKLEGFGLLQTVLIQKERRHNIAYIVRTARIFLFEDPQKDFNKYNTSITEFAKLYSILNPNESKINTQDFYKELIDSKKSREKNHSQKDLQNRR